MGDQVWFLRKNVRTTQSLAKLDYRRLRNFKIIKQMASYTYKLDVPVSMKIHSIFNISLLELAATDPLPRQIQPPPPPTIIDCKPEYKVNEIVNFKLVQKQLKYRSCWVGYFNLAWKPAENVVNPQTAFTRFHNLHLQNHDQNHQTRF